MLRGSCSLSYGCHGRGPRQLPKQRGLQRTRHRGPRAEKGAVGLLSHPQDAFTQLVNPPKQCRPGLTGYSITDDRSGPGFAKKVEGKKCGLFFAPSWGSDGAIRRREGFNLGGSSLVAIRPNVLFLVRCTGAAFGLGA